MKIFIAGIIQGSVENEDIYNQSYRFTLTSKIKNIFPECEIIDPHILHPERFEFTVDEKREMFIKYALLAGKSDCVIAYLPEASMGTAIEMWEAYSNGIPILTVSTLEYNWVVQSLSTKLFKSIKNLIEFISEPEFISLIKLKEGELYE